MASARGPDWDFYQCKCGNIVFEYNIVTGEKCLSDTWKNCTTTCMEPVSYVPPCARPFNTVTIPVSRPRRHMATQTSEDVSSRSVDTQTASSGCSCYSSSVLPASSNDADNCCDTTHGNLWKDKTSSAVTDVESEKDFSQEKTDVTSSNAKDFLVKTENTSEPTTCSLPLSNEDKHLGSSNDRSDRVLRKRKSDPVGEKRPNKDSNRKPKSNRRL